MSFDKFLRKAGDFIKEAIDKDDDDEQQQQQQPQAQSSEGRPQEQQHHEGGGNSHNRFRSSFPQSAGDIKWYVDGAAYFHAVSMALEQAQESIYILDWWLSPELYLRRPPARNEKYRLDKMLKAAAERGVEVRVIVYKEVKAALSCDSAHTKHALEDLHENIRVFRHPDHVPNKEDLTNSFQGMSLNPMSLAKASTDALASLYGSIGDSVLFWAHHEKLCLVDRKIVFMGGLDMCFGRWDTNSHPIADAHPGNLDDIIFPGQDFNNARVFDFEGVDNWDHNQLDRTKSSRMGWSDVTLSMRGPIVNSLIAHFGDRWNFIFNEKYTVKDPGKYQRINVGHGSGGHNHQMFDSIRGALHRGMGRASHDDERHEDRESEHIRSNEGSGGNTSIQLCRSACEWSHGSGTEHSIANAYIEAITNARHFVYIENQFFITATGDDQKPVSNKLGAAIVDRIVRAHENQENFHIIVVMPAVPAFPGDLKSDGALGTRAIMEFQYNSICRGGNSIIECVQRRGVEDWGRYIHFHNLRNYDRINISKIMQKAEKESGVRYEDARRDYDDHYGERRDEGDGGRSYEQRGDGHRRSGGYDDDRRGGYGEERRDYGYSEERRDYDDDRRRGDGYGGGRYESSYGDSRRDYDDSYGGSGLRGGGYGDEYGDQDEYPGYGDSYGRRDDYGDRQEYGGRQEYGDRQEYGGREEYGRQEYGREEYRREEYRREESGGREEYGRRRDDSLERREQYGGQGHSGDYERYQQAATKVSDQTWDTVSSCYMEGGLDIREVPWNGSEEDEFNAFVSEELYIHSKLLIADDRLVICGSANINDRSQLGNHDSEIAVVVEDPNPDLETTMDGRPFRASRFAASLRRFLYRKHLGLVADQRWDQPTAGWTPVGVDPQHYDWDSDSDRRVADPMTREFWDLWLGTARTNTEVFERAFHPVPTDRVRNWKQYDEFFGDKFIIPGTKYKDDEREGRVDYGHVVRDEFPGGVRELKDQLARVRGTLVEMPLKFLEELGEDLAIEGVGLNFATKEIYT